MAREGFFHRVAAAARVLVGRDAPPSRAEPAHAAVRDEVPEPTVVRRWESAETTRLNEAHWIRASSNGINQDLSLDLATLRTRCCFEAYNNPIVEGVIRTYGIDFVGPTGPTLQVLSDSEPYNRALRQVWEDWFAHPTVDGQLSGTDWLHLCNWGFWTKGPALAQLVRDPDATRDDAVLTKLLPLDPDRLKTPADAAGDPDVCLGVRRNRLGKPLEYNIVDYDQPYGMQLVERRAPNWIPAEDVLHCFEPIEAAQATGFPWLASSLQEIADLRDYDVQVLDAARAAAETGVYFSATGAEAEERFQVFNSEVSLKRRIHRFLPPGYTPHQINPGQPATQYIPYRHEKLRAIGRPAHMPLLLILLSAEQSNFSQSRIDVNVFYERGLAVRRRWFEGAALNRLVTVVEREARLARRGGQFVLPRRPERVRYSWQWDPIPQADPQKHVAALVTALQWGILTYEDVLGQYGKNPDEVIAKRAEVNAKLAAAGLDPIPGPPANQAGPPEHEADERDTDRPGRRTDDDEEEDTEETPAGRRREAVGV